MQALSAHFDSGARDALQVLNAGVSHRYSSIFRLAGGALENLVFVDKQGEPMPELFRSIPLAESFCQLVLRDGSLKAIYASSDVRLSYSPYHKIIGGYHGVVITGEDGSHYGTVCHYDVVARKISDEEFGLLGEFAKLVVPHLSSLSR